MIVKTRFEKFIDAVFWAVITLIIAAAALAVLFWASAAFADECAELDASGGIDLGGSNRYETSANIALEAYPEGADGVIIATGENFPDALAASGLSGLLDYPILLTKTDYLSGNLADTIDKLGAWNAIIVGGPVAVSEDVEQDLGLLLGKRNVTRIYGKSRYQTAERIYEYGDSLYGEATPHWGSQCIIATAKNFPDALSISSYAYAAKCPILLSDPEDGLTERTGSIVRDGGFRNVLIVGGYSAVPYCVDEWIGDATDCGISRIGGADRYETSAMIAGTVLANDWYTANGACIATGRNFPDALSGAPLAGKRRSVVLLADEGQTDVLDVLKLHSGEVRRIYYLGGLSAVPSSVRMYAEWAAWAA